MPVELTASLAFSQIRHLRALREICGEVGAETLNHTAQTAQGAWRAGHTVFHRRNSWIDKGVRVGFASPNRLNAKVGTIDTYMGRHIVGIEEEKQAKNDGRLFIPEYEDIAEVPTHKKMRSALRQMARTKTKPFERRGILLRREGMGHGAPLVVLGFLRKMASIKPRLNSLEIVQRVVDRTFPRKFEEMIQEWIETGRVERAARPWEK